MFDLMFAKWDEVLSVACPKVILRATMINSSLIIILTQSEILAYFLFDSSQEMSIEMLQDIFMRKIMNEAP